MLWCVARAFFFEWIRQPLSTLRKSRRERLTYRLEILDASVYFTDPVTTDLTPATTFPRTLSLGLRVEANDSIRQFCFLIALSVYLQVSAKALLQGEGLALA